MGAVVGFELARHLRAQNKPLPAKLFVSGRGAPQLPSAEAAIHALPHQQFLECLHQLNGTPEEVFADAELVELLLPLLRADFELIETYCYVPGPPLELSITAFGGLDDALVLQRSLADWHTQSIGSFRMQMFPGDHFFLRQAQTALVRSLAHDLEPLL